MRRPWPSYASAGSATGGDGDGTIPVVYGGGGASTGGGGGGGSGGGGTAQTYAETAGGVAHTWTDYSDAGGTEGPSIGAGQTVGVVCKVNGFAVEDGNTWWYLIGSSPWNASYFVSADAIYNNGATSGDLHGTPFVDPAVPECAGTTGSNPTPVTPPVITTPPTNGTYTETTGGVTHTWTNYSNAGAETPSDFSGVVYISLSSPDWKLHLAREMKTAGLDIDMNKALE